MYGRAYGEVYEFQIISAKLNCTFSRKLGVESCWSKETLNAFLEKSRCMENQYNNYIIKQINVKVNGTKTLNENIADNGGIKLAYVAYGKFEYFVVLSMYINFYLSLTQRRSFLSRINFSCTFYRPMGQNTRRWHDIAWIAFFDKADVLDKSST